MDIAVVGGGVSGVVSAIELSKLGHKVSIYEKTDRLLKKLLITGNGRCNFSNKNISRDNFHGSKKFLDKIYTDEFIDARDYIINLGIIPYLDERNRFYPMSLQAQSVVEALLKEVEDRDINCFFKSEVISINKNKKLTIKPKDTSMDYDRVIFSAGSMSYPSTGTDGSQYKLVEDLGHTKTKLYPGIGPLVADIPFSKELKGLRLNATVYAGDKSCNGDLLFTENGISGNSIFELSSYILREKIDKIYIDFLPLVDLDDLKIILKLRQDKLNDVDSKWFLNGIIHKRLYKVFFKMLNVKTTKDIDIDKLCKLIKNYEVSDIRAGSWALSQITVGGINTDEIDTNLESKIHKGLYFTGEVLDVDGDCGGYNLTWAIYSALLVAKMLR